MGYKEKSRVSIGNVEDCKDNSGMWLKTYSTCTDECYTKYTTRAGQLWFAINSRCSPRNSLHLKVSTYKECSNGFSDFQEFAQWCQEQFGYLNKTTNGKFWALDKDIKEYGNTVYSPQSCLFVPDYINSLLVLSYKDRGLPMGVVKYKGKFLAQMQGLGKSPRLGLFENPLDAHRCWQESKVKRFETVISDNINELGEALITALNRHIERLQKDIETGTETLHPRTLKMRLL